MDFEKILDLIIKEFDKEKIIPKISKIPTIKERF